MLMAIHIGTSGFSYEHWKDDVFYPRDLRQKDQFSFYTTRFNTVELNVSFYRLLKKEAFERWAKNSPADFLFAVKGSRYITHNKKLLGVEEALKRFSESASGLNKKLAMVLWQFPESFKKNNEKLNYFCRLLKKDPYLKEIRQTFEFRDESWFSEDIYKVLKKYNFALCVTDSPIWPAAEVVTADYVYMRFHGGKKLYGSEYSQQELTRWAAKITEWQKQGFEIFAYFNNDAFGFAPKNANELIAIISSI